MILSPGLRKFVLNVHLTSSVGWIGAVLAFLALIIAAMNSQDDQMLRVAWIGMGLIGLYIIVPLALTSLFTGIVMSLGTKWGLFQHYWVLISLVLTIFTVVILLGNMQTVRVFAGIAVGLNSDDVYMLRAALQSDLLHGGLGLLVLLVIQVLNVYKPRGLTLYGWRKQQAQRAERQTFEAANPLESPSVLSEGR